MATQTFELVSPFLTIYAPSKKWAGESNLLLGQTATRLVTGELLQHTGANGVIRPVVTIGNSKNATNNNFGVNEFTAPYFSETGRGDIVTGGSVPILQFGPFEADTMLFMRANDDQTSNVGEGLGSITNAPITGLSLGAAVYACAVRNPLNGSTFNSNNYVIGVGPAAGMNNESRIVGRISRISMGTGASAKIRVMFGVN